MHLSGTSISKYTVMLFRSCSIDSASFHLYSFSLLYVQGVGGYINRSETLKQKTTLKHIKCVIAEMFVEVFGDSDDVFSLFLYEVSVCLSYG